MYIVFVFLLEVSILQTLTATTTKIIYTPRPCKAHTFEPLGKFWVEPKALKIEGYN